MRVNLSSSRLRPPLTQANKVKKQSGWMNRKESLLSLSPYLNIKLCSEAEEREKPAGLVTSEGSCLSHQHFHKCPTQN